MKTKNIIFIIIVAIVLLLILVPNVQANTHTWDNMLEWEFDNPVLPPVLIKIIGTIIAWLRNLSIILTVLVITVLGVKYMLGSVSEKAEYKKDYIEIIKGVILISCIFEIVSIIFSLSEMF